MFFNKISEYSNKSLKWLYIGFLSLYFLFMLVCPIVVIATRYQIFKEINTYSLTGMGVCLLLIFVVVGMKALSNKIKTFPENTLAQRRVKFSFQLGYSLVIPIIAVAILVTLWLSFDRAFATLRDCLVFYVLAVLVDNLFVKYIESERKLRFDAQADVEKAKRIHLFK